MSNYLGSFIAGARVDVEWTTVSPTTFVPTAMTSGSMCVRKISAGTPAAGSLAPLGVATITVSGGTARVTVFTASDAVFFSTGADYHIEVGFGAVSGSTVAGYVVGHFDIANRTVNWGQVSAPTTTVGLSGTTIKTATDVETKVDTIDNFLDTEIGSPSDFGSGASIAANLVDIEAQTDDIGAAGAGLTAINLPNQTMDIIGNITGNLSGSVGSVTGAVGSVTGAVGSVTGNVGGNVTGTIGSLATQAKADVQLEAEEALQTYHLDHLMHTADPAPTSVGTGSLWANLTSKTSSYSTYTGTTDSLEALSDAIATVDDYVDTEVAAILVDTATTLDDMLETLLTSDVTIKKNTAFATYPIIFTNTAGVVQLGNTITATRSIDGGAFAACANAVTEVGIGLYKVDLDATDVNGKVIVLNFTGTGATVQHIVITQD